MSALPAQRPVAEVRAYLEGFRAAAKMFEERAALHTDGEPSALRAAAAEVKSVGDLIEEGLRP